MFFFNCLKVFVKLTTSIDILSMTYVTIYNANKKIRSQTSLDGVIYSVYCNKLKPFLY